METDYLLGDAWTLIGLWCMVAMQVKANGESHLALKFVPAFSAEEVFLSWCEKRMDNMFGSRVGKGGGEGEGGT